MAQLIDLGKIRFDYKGAYSGSTQYELNDVVKENNNLYVYTNGAATTGNATSDTNYWDLMIDGFDVSNDVTLADASTIEVPTENAVKTYVDTEIAGLADSAPETLNTLNELAAALGDDANFATTVTNSIATKLPLAGGTLTGGLTVPSATVNGTLDIEEVYEKVNVSNGTSGAITFNTLEQGVNFYNVNQTANRTINFTNVNANLAIGQSVTCAVLMAQGSTAYYLNAYQVDGSAVTPKWQGGAPTEGKASGIDTYSFTIIKTADATFTVLASVAAFA